MKMVHICSLDDWKFEMDLMLTSYMKRELYNAVYGMIDSRGTVMIIIYRNTDPVFCYYNQIGDHYNTERWILRDYSIFLVNKLSFVCFI